MKKLTMILVPAFFLLLGCSTNNTSDNLKTSGNKMENINISNITVKTIDGEDKSLSDYNDKVLLIVNVASQCGNTPQYKGLESIYEKYKGQGFEILAFPSNDFGGQEPGTNEEIKEFCELNYNVTFPLFDKVKVLGDDRAPLYTELIQTEPEGEVKWNFEKFLVDKSGNVVKRFGNKVLPESDEVTATIEEELTK
jgi:glutathione peroxidase